MDKQIQHIKNIQESRRKGINPFDFWKIVFQKPEYLKVLKETKYFKKEEIEFWHYILTKSYVYTYFKFYKPYIKMQHQWWELLLSLYEEDRVEFLNHITKSVGINNISEEILSLIKILSKELNDDSFIKILKDKKQHLLQTPILDFCTTEITNKSLMYVGKLPNLIVLKFCSTGITDCLTLK